MKDCIIIAAIGKNNELGKNNDLIFHIKEDMQNFKKLTSGNIVIMGRKTFESINSKPLVDRLNIVISRNAKDHENINDKLLWFSTIEDAILYVNNLPDNRKAYIIGGGQIYKETLDKGIVNEMVLTIVDETIEDADVYFPEIKQENWIGHILAEGENYSIVKFVIKMEQPL